MIAGSSPGKKIKRSLIDFATKYIDHISRGIEAILGANSHGIVKHKIQQQNLDKKYVQ